MLAAGRASAAPIAAAATITVAITIGHASRISRFIASSLLSLTKPALDAGDREDFAAKGD